MKTTWNKVKTETGEKKTRKKYSTSILMAIQHTINKLLQIHLMNIFNNSRQNHR
jgi:hypothetical protein